MLPQVPAPARSPAGEPELDLAVVVAEIYEDVARRRRSGEYPPGLERELDALFAQYAPPAAVGDDMAVILDRAERASFIDVDVPTASARPAVPYVKRGLRTLMAWYLRYVAQQVGALGSVLTRGLALVDGRLARLEEAVPAVSTRILDELRDVPAAPVPERWRRFTVEHLAAARPPGRVLHTECGEGALVIDLLAAGIDAYGVDPQRARLSGAIRAGVDVRAEATLDHLRRLEPGALGGLVLTGVVERVTASALVELVDLAVDALVPGGLVVVVSGAPETWATTAGAVAADLAPGRPLHAATWRHLLEVRGFSEIATVDGDPLEGAPVLVPASDPDDVPGAANLHAAIAALNARLFPPASYAVVGRRALPVE